MFLQFFGSFFKKINDSLIPSERSEQIAQVAQAKWATMSDSLRRSEGMIDLERIAQVAHQKWANELIAHFLSESLICSLFLAKNERFAPKFNERIPNPV